MGKVMNVQFHKKLRKNKEGEIIRLAKQHGQVMMGFVDFQKKNGIRPFCVLHASPYVLECHDLESAKVAGLNADGAKYVVFGMPEDCETFREALLPTIGAPVHSARTRREGIEP